MNSDDILNQWDEERKLTSVPVGSTTVAPEKPSNADKLLDQWDEDIKSRFQYSISQAVKDNPDRVAKAKMVADELGVSVDLAERNLDDLDTLYKAKSIERMQLAATNPVLYRQMLDPQFAKIAHDQLAGLGLVERTARNLAAGFGGDFVGSSIKGLGHTMHSIERLTGTKSLTADTLIDVGETTKKYWQDLAPQDEQSFMDQVARGVGQMPGQLALMSNPYTALAGLALMYGQGADQMAEKIAKDKAAQQADQTAQDLEILSGGAITAATEWLSSKLLLHPPQLLAIKNRLLAYAAKVAIGAGEEGLQEPMENIGQDLAHIALTNPDSKVAFGEAVEAGGVGAIVGALTSAVINGALHIRGRRFQAALSDLSDATKAQALRERDPATYQSYADALAGHLASTTDGAVENLYVDANVFHQLMTAAQIDPTEAAQAMGIDPQAYEEAKVTGGDVVIPINDFIGKVAGTEVGDMLGDHLRSTPDSLSLAETAQAAQMAEGIQTKADEIAAKQEDRKAWQQSSNEVRQQIFEQLQTAGNFAPAVSRAYSTFVQNWYSVMAEREGITPSELYQRMPYKVQSGELGGGGMMQGGKGLRLYRGDSVNADGIGEGSVGGLGKGHYFVSVPHIAEYFTDGSDPSHTRQFDVVAQNPFDLMSWDIASDPRWQAMLNTLPEDPEIGQKPKTWLKKWANNEVDTKDAYGAVARSFGYQKDTFNDFLAKFGYDSVVDQGTRGVGDSGRQYVVFDKNAISVPLRQSSFAGMSARAQEIAASLGITPTNGALAPSDLLYSTRTWTQQEKAQIQELAKEMGIEEEKAAKWMYDIDNAMARVLADPSLDFIAEAADLYSALKPNSDSHYTVSLDFSTLCRKRYELIATIEAIQNLTGRALTKETWVDVRQRLDEMGYNVSCGACYVDSKRMEAGKFVNAFIDAHPDEDPKQFLSQAGIDQLKRDKPELYAEFKKAIGSNNAKTPESRTDYHGEIREYFIASSAGKKRVAAMNKKSGLRWQSWSDFEVPHLMDAMQAILDMHMAGLMGHAYTKVPDFVLALGKTGLMVNMSLIPKGTGLTTDGKLVFDGKEGMDFDVALELREANEMTAGTIAIGVSNEHIKALLADPRIDYVIPYHASGLSKEIAKKFNMDGWEDYTDTQTEDIADFALFHKKVGKSNAKLVDLYQKEMKKKPNQRDFTAYRKAAKASGLVGIEIFDYWDNTKSGPDNAKAYLALAASRGVAPKFRGKEYGTGKVLADLTQEEGYWKLLIDLKMYDHSGNNIVQQPVKPEYDMDAINGIYDRASENPVPSAAVADVVNEFAQKEGYSGPLFQSAIRQDDVAITEMYQKQQGGNRRAGFYPQSLTTILTQQSDYSSFLHETAHFFLTAYAQLAADPNASERTKGDMQIILEWFGVESLDAWNAMTLEEQRKYHEQFAYNFEIYLFEGKAPNPQMQTVFERFSAWLKKVYTSIRDDLNQIYRQEHGADLPLLTGEVRQVMDRMLASDQQISQAEAIRGMAPIFTSQEEAGMDDAQWAAYQEMQQEAHEQALSEHQTASLRQMKWLEGARGRALKALQAEVKAIRDKIKTEVTKAVMGRPVYRAIRFIKGGEFETPGDASQATKRAATELGMGKTQLSTEALRQMYGEEANAAWRYLPTNMVSKDGVHPDLIAGLFGYANGDAMVRDILAAKPMRDAIREETDQRMLEEHGELTDPKAMGQAVDQAVHNEARARFLAVELRHLAKGQRPVRVMQEAARQAARGVLNRRAVKDIRPHEFAAAEARAAKAAEDAMKKGDTKAATQHKEHQVLQNALAVEAMKAKSEVAKKLEGFKQVFASDKRLAKGRDMNYVNAARAILATYGLGTTEQGAGFYLAKIKQYDPEFYAEIEGMITAHQAVPRQIMELSLEEFTDLADQIGALWHLSRRTKQIEIDGQLLDRKQIVGELNDEIRDLITAPNRPGYTKAMTDWEEAKIKLMGARASLRRVESWIDTMDRGNPDGVFRRYIWNPISEAVTEFRLAKNEYLSKYVAMLNEAAPLLKGKDIVATEIGYTFRPQELLHAVLHTGNTSNKRKLLLGRGWATLNEDGQTLDTRNWDAFIARAWAEGILTKEHYDFAQKVWDLMESMKPAAQKAHRQMYGFYFNEITAEPVQTPWGSYAGGYVPAVTDSRIVTEGAMRNEQETQMGDNSFMFPTTGRGFTKGRVEYNKPLLLDLAFLAGHMDKVLRFSYIEPKIKDAARIVKTNKAFSEAMDELDPTIRGDMLVPWLQRTAMQMVSIPSKGWGGTLADQAFTYLRTNTGMQMMVGNITNTLQQFTGLSISMLKVRPGRLGAALVQYVRQPGDTTAMVAEKSDYMATRMSSSQYELTQTMDQLLLNPDKYDKLVDFAKKHGYFMQQATQSVVDTITWVGAYNQAVETGFDEKAAVRQADSAVRETQGSFAPEDISRFETGSAFMRAFTHFYSYFNMQANLLGTEFTKTARELGVKKGAGKMLYIYTFGFMVPAVLSEMIVQAMGGFDAGDDDEYDVLDAMGLFFMSQFRTLMAMVPGVGPAVAAGVNAFNRKPYDDRMSTSPAVSTIEAVASSPHSVYKAIAEDGSWKKASRDVLTTLGLITRLPLGQLGKPAGYLADVAQGKAEPESAMDVARGLISGKDVNRKQ